MIGELTNHMWQSTLFAVAAGLLTAALRKNRAQVRFWLWLSASVKFFVPFSLLMSLGSQLHWAPAADRIAVQTLSSTMAQLTQPFDSSMLLPALTQHNGDWIPIAILAVWACGFALVALMRLRAWLRIRSACNCAVPVGQTIVFRGLSSCSIRTSPGLLEPGVVGIFRPILLLPAGIEERLTPPQLETVLAHELCHVRRRDNLFSSIHMLVEALFWFHPLVWWIGARLVEERERACDESVLTLGSEPHVYAEAILNVCRLYVESPLECVSGVTGADLKKRIEAIMTKRTGQALDRAKKFLLAGAGVAAVAVPLAIGVARAPAVRAQAPAATTQSTEKPLAFDAASIKPIAPSGGGRGSFGGGVVQVKPPLVVQGRSVSTRRMILEAYHLTDQQLSGGGGWLDSDMYELEAKAATPSNDTQLRQMLQTLLSDRFKLAVHREPREMQVLVMTVAKNGLKVHELKEGEPVPTSIPKRTEAPGPALIFTANMSDFARLLSGNPSIRRPVLDQTGLPGTYFFGVQWSPDEDFMTVMQQEFGLKLESKKAPMDILIIDRIEKPSEN